MAPVVKCFECVLFRASGLCNLHNYLKIVRNFCKDNHGPQRMSHTDFGFADYHQNIIYYHIITNGGHT